MTEKEQVGFRNPIKELGFAIIPHIITRDNELSDGAYRTYASIIEFAQQKNKAWPGRDRLAKRRNKGVRTIDAHLRELIDKGYITRQQRRHSTAYTFIEDIETIDRLTQLLADFMTAENGKDKPIPAENGEPKRLSLLKMASRDLLKMAGRIRIREEEKDLMDEEKMFPIYFHNAKMDLKERVGIGTYNHLIKKIILCDVVNNGSGRVLIIEAPRHYDCDWLQNREGVGEVIIDHFEDAAGEVFELEFVAEDVE